MCLYTTQAQNKRFVPTIKNKGIPAKVPMLIKTIGGNPTPLLIRDERITKVPIPCGKCIICRQKNKRNWQVRLQEEIKHNELTAVFVTFTFNTEELTKLYEEIKQEYPTLKGYDRDNKIAKLAVKRFLQRWKKHNKNKSVKHWLITELGHGQWEHLHLHGILWTNKTEEFIQERWNYGNIWTSLKGLTKNGQKGYVNNQTINYIVKYVSKIDITHTNYKQIVLASPGIGKEYLTRRNLEHHKYQGEQTIETYRLPNGKKIPLATYYKRKIWTEEERQELWRDKLDKQIEYIGKEAVDTSTYQGIEDWFRIRQHYREMNKTLGGGDNKIDWIKRKIENTRRNEIYFERCVKRRKNKGMPTYEMEANQEKLIKSVRNFKGKSNKLIPKHELDLTDDIELITLYNEIPQEAHQGMTRKELKKMIIGGLPDAFEIWGAMEEDENWDWTQGLRI